MTTPNFSPTGGIGSIWKDPASGKTWKYTSGGWQEDSGSVSQDAQNKGTFVVKPEEEPVVNTLKTGGAKDADIQAALKQRQDILATKSTQDSATTITDTPVATLTQDSKDPFRGKTKADVLREAFNNGVTDNKELDNLSKTYDLLANPVTEGGVDLSALSPVQQEIAKKSLEKEAVKKMSALPDAVARENTLGALSTFSTGKDLIDMLDSGKVNTGLVAGAMNTGVFGIGGRKLGKTSKEQNDFNALSEIFAANYRKAMSGTAVSDTELARLERFLPAENKTIEDNISGILQMSDYLSKRTSLQLGLDVTPLAPSEGNKDPLNLSSRSQGSTKNYLGI